MESKKSVTGAQLWQRGYYDHIIRNEDEYFEEQKDGKNRPFVLLVKRLPPARHFLLRTVKRGIPAEKPRYRTGV